jgi:hypothetical protein
VLPLHDAAYAGVRDGVLVFIERHLKPMVAKQQPALKKAMRTLVRALEQQL